MHEALETSTEAFLGLSSLATQGASGVGRFSLQLDRFQRSSSSGPEPLNGISAELLPIPIVLARPFLVSRCSLNRGADEAEQVEATLGVLAAPKVFYSASDGRISQFSRLPGLLWAQVTNVPCGTSGRVWTRLCLGVLSPFR